MTITVNALWIPVILTLVFLAIMARPYRRTGDYDFGGLLRIFWLFPIAGVWIFFLCIILWVK